MFLDEPNCNKAGVKRLGWSSEHEDKKEETKRRTNGMWRKTPGDKGNYIDR